MDSKDTNLVLLNTYVGTIVKILIRKGVLTEEELKSELTEELNRIVDVIKELEGTGKDEKIGNS